MVVCVEVGFMGGDAEVAVEKFGEERELDGGWEDGRVDEET